jgi:hypothetical protein
MTGPKLLPQSLVLALVVLATWPLAAPAGLAPAPEAPAAASDAAAQAAKAFESLYGADVNRVRATREPGDDVQLARQLLAAAERAGNQPDFVAVLCDSACDLALVSPDGYALAAQAVERLAAARPERAAACAEKMVEIRQRQFDVAKGDARPAAGEALVAAILAVIDSGTKNDFDTVTLFKRALGVARLAGSPRADEVEARMNAHAQAMKVARQIEDVKAMIAREPGDATLREKLVRLYLIDKDDPAAAAECLEGVGDESLMKYVPAAARPLEAAPELACLELGEWYRALGESAAPAAKGAMFARAKAYYERFLALHAAQDLDRTRALVALQKVAAAGLAPSPAPARPARPPRPAPKTEEKEQWIDLLALVDPEKDAVAGKWQRAAGGLQVSPAGHGRVCVPLVIKGSYQLSTTFVRRGGTQGVSVILPVGGTGVVFTLNPLGKNCGSLRDVNKADFTTTPGKLENGRDYTLDVNVLVNGTEGDITIALDGRPYMKWQGPVSALSVSRDFMLPTLGCIGVVANASDVVFKSLRLRMESGEAKPLRPWQTPPRSRPARLAESHGPVLRTSSPTRAARVCGRRTEPSGSCPVSSSAATRCGRATAAPPRVWTSRRRPEASRHRASVRRAW